MCQLVAPPAFAVTDVMWHCIAPCACLRRRAELVVLCVPVSETCVILPSYCVDLTLWHVQPHSWSAAWVWAQKFTHAQDGKRACPYHVRHVHLQYDRARALHSRMTCTALHVRVRDTHSTSDNHLCAMLTGLVPKACPLDVPSTASVLRRRLVNPQPLIPSRGCTDTVHAHYNRRQ